MSHTQATRRWLAGLLATALALGIVGLAGCGDSPGPETESFDGVWSGTTEMSPLDELSFRVEDEHVVAFDVPQLCGATDTVLEDRVPLETDGQFRLGTTVQVTVTPTGGQAYEAEQEVTVTGRISSSAAADGEITVKVSAPWQRPTSCSTAWSATPD